MSVVIRLKVPIEMHYTVIPMGTSKVNSFLKLILRKFKKIKKDKKYKKKTKFNHYAATGISSSAC